MHVKPIRYFLLSIVFLLLQQTTGLAQLYSYTSATTGAYASVAANVTGSSLTRVNGAAAPGSPCSSGFSSTNFTTATSYTPSLPAVNVDITPTAGYQLNVTSFSVGLRRSGTGPAQGMLAYSINNGSTWVTQGTIVAPNNSTCGSMATFTWTLPATVTLAATFKFRIFLWNASGSGGTQQIMNLTINGSATTSVAPCTTPGSATNFLYTIASPTQTNVNWTAPTGGASGYIVIASTNATLSAQPQNGTSYAAGTAIGGGTVLYNGSAASFSATGLNPTADYYYFIYPYNNTNCSGGPLYATPLIGNDKLPVVTDAPADTVCAGANVVFAVTAINTSAYIWQEYTTSWNNLSASAIYTGVNTSQLGITNSAGLNGRQYRVIAIGNANVNDTSAGSLLTVKELPAIATQPVAAISCAGTDTSFSITATGTDNNYQWQENTGNGFVNIANNSNFSGATTAQLHITGLPYALNGHTYRCVAYNVCGSDTATPGLLTVNPLPTAAITYSTANPAFCQGDSLVLKTAYNSGYQYQWLQNGSNIAGATTDSITVLTGANYSVWVSDLVTGCNLTTAALLVTANPLPAANVTPATSTAICAGSQAVLTASTGTALSYQWLLNGTPVTGAIFSTLTVTTAGSYQAVVTNTATNCKNTSSVTALIVNPLPATQVTAAGPVSFCNGYSVALNAAAGYQYQWLMNSNTITGANNNSYTATLSGDYRVAVMDAVTGCKDTSTVTTVTVFATIALFSVNPPAPIACDSVLLTPTLAATTYTVQWQQNGADIPGATNYTYSAKATATYTVRFTSSNGCSQTSAVASVVINASPVAGIAYSSPLSFCEGGAVALTAYGNAGTTYQWYKNGNAITGATTATNIAAATGAYALLASNSAGCNIFSAVVPVVVYPLPLPVITKTGMTLSTGSYTSYQWYYNNQVIAGANQQTYTATKNGGYSVVVTDGNGCFNQTSTIIINNVGVANQAGIDKDIIIYPNPAQDYIAIESTLNSKTGDVLLYNAVGTAVHKANGVKQINVANYASGYYVICVYDTEGILLKKAPVVIKH